MPNELPRDASRYFGEQLIKHIMADLLQGSEIIDWKLLGIFTAFSVAGIFIGILLSKKIPGQKLKKGFGWFVMVMGIYIIIKELFFK